MKNNEYKKITKSKKIYKVLLIIFLIGFSLWCKLFSGWLPEISSANQSNYPLVRVTIVLILLTIVCVACLISMEKLRKIFKDKSKSSQISTTKKINYDGLVKRLKQTDNLVNYLIDDNTALFRTYKRKFIAKEYASYYILDLEKYDEKTINKKIAIVNDKYEKKFGTYEPKVGDFIYHNTYILVFIDEWDENADKLTESANDSTDLWDTTLTYIIYDNKLFCQKGAENFVGKSEFNKNIDRLLDEFK